MKTSIAKKLLSGALSVTLIAGLCPGLAIADATSGSSERSGAATQLTAASLTASSQVKTAASKSKVKSYSYSATPILSPFNWALYVKTNNPDPKSFRLADKSSTYLKKGDGPATYSVLDRNFLDVKYEKAKTFRVKGGYIFYCYNVNSDGGVLHVQQLNSDGSYSDTGKKVQVPALKDSIDYLIDTYAKDKSSFFEKLNGVQSGLYALSVYPRSVYDCSNPSKTSGWPSLASSPYAELGLNDHYEGLYPRSESGIFLKALHPYVLDSLGFPGTIATAARAINPKCTVTRGSAHWEVKVTYNGETHTYGWAGEGGAGPLYSNTVSRKYTFDGKGSDLAKTTSVADLSTLYLEYLSKSDKQLEKYRDMIQGETFRKTIGTGCWARIAVESFFGGGGRTYAYITGSEDASYAYAVSNTWVDGSYVNEYERIEPGAQLSDHPQAAVLVRNKSFTDASGKAHKCDLMYYHDSATGTWQASGYGYGYSSSSNLPSAFVLTKAQVQALIAKNTNKLPASGKIYDGTKRPGTAFENIAATGISMAKSSVAYVKGNTQLTATVKPAKATEKHVNWTSKNPNIATVSSDGIVTGVKTGKARIVATTVDGAYTATCTVTVKKPTSIKKATVAKIAAQKWKGKEVTPKPVVKHGKKKLVEGKDYTLSYSNNWGTGTAKVTISGINAYSGKVTKKFSIYIAIKKPKAKSYKYNGKVRFGIPSGEGYWIDGTEGAISPGTYKAKVRLYSGYRWSNGSTKPLKLTWKIRR